MELNFNWSLLLGMFLPIIFIVFVGCGPFQNVSYYDADGITSTVLLVELLSKLGAKVKPFIPSRQDEGYGLLCQAYPKSDLKIIANQFDAVWDQR